MPASDRSDTLSGQRDPHVAVLEAGTDWVAAGTHAVPTAWVLLVGLAALAGAAIDLLRDRRS